MNLKTWISQPSTISGLGNLLGVVVTTGVQVALHATPIAIGAGIVAKAAVSLLINDNTASPAAANSVEQLVVDAVTAIATQHVQQAIPTLTADVLKTLTSGGVSIQPAPSPVAPPSNSPAA